MKNYSTKILTTLFFSSILFISCASDDTTEITMEEEDTDAGTETEIVTGELHAAFAEFDEGETDIYLINDGADVTIETTGLPNHESYYWGSNHELFREEDNSFQGTPSTINPDGTYTDMRGEARTYDDSFTVSTSPSLATNTTSTSLGLIGISVSGAAIYNDQEGSGSLDEAAVSLDWTGGHIGPDVYHYHLEPHAITNDDEKLVGILKDGFFIYGRKCNSTGTYPTDLDSSGGHTHTTQHSESAEYHYHIINEMYSTTSSGDVGYILFAGPYKGSL